MFKLKPGNVFQKINHMDRKQAYTWGAIIIVCLISLLTLISFISTPADPSFTNMDTRGYDLAQMPFVNDEAEQFLLANKYPDMQENGSTLLYSAEEKEARQEADALAEEENDEEDSSSGNSDSSYSSSDVTSNGYSGRSYGGGRGTGTPTQINQLGSASTTHASGSGVSGSFGAPRGDFSNFKNQNKGREIPTNYQLKNQDARKALYQFARGSQAAAGLKDGKSGNAKRALMGGDIAGSEAFTDKGVDLSKTGGLALDTNAPVSSADLSNLDDKVNDGVNDAKNNNDPKEDFWTRLWHAWVEGLVNGLTDAAMSLGKDYLYQHWDITPSGSSSGNNNSGSGICKGKGYTVDKDGNVKCNS